MHRKPASGFPANSCSIRMPDATFLSETFSEEPDGDQQRRRQQLINFAHSHWGFKNWSWAVTKQDLDFVDYSNGKYCAGVVAFVSVTVKSMDIHREDIGYATTQAVNKGSAIFQARKCAVTNALKETLLSFGGTFATGLMELLEAQKSDHVKLQPPELQQENNQNVINKVEALEPKNSAARNVRKDSSDSNTSRETSTARSPHKNIAPIAQNKQVPVAIAKAQPIPANQVPVLSKPVYPPANQIPPKPQAQQAAGAPLTHMRPNSNESNKLPDLASMTEEEQRAERKRRQKQAQEEFRIKQLQKHGANNIDDGDSMDTLIMDIRSQELVDPNLQPATLKRKPTEDTLHTNKRCSN